MSKASESGSVLVERGTGFSATANIGINSYDDAIVRKFVLATMLWVS